ncbi:MAG TPA: glycosyltransferase 87 family protein [Trebonia sp.]
MTTGQYRQWLDGYPSLRDAAGAHQDRSAGELTVPEAHRPWLDRRGITAAYGAFAAYAAVAAFTTAGQDRVWALWALPGYAAAFVLLLRGRGWTPALTVSVVLSLVVPLISLCATWPLTAGMVVIGRSAELLLHSGLPYLPQGQLSSWLSYDPYLPAMALFGMPRAAGLSGLAGHPGVWMAVATVAVLALAAWYIVPDRPARCPRCRRDVLLLVAFAAASPVIALNLAVITTDPPVLALMLLSFALAAGPSRAVGAGLALGLACALKVTAWPEIPVLAAMFWSRDGARTAGRFVASSAVAAAALIAATAPAVFTRPSAIVQNAVLFPLGLTRHKTPAQSPLPGHLLASAGPAGHLLAVTLLLAAAVGIVVSLVVRPPRTVDAATFRLAVGLAVMFTLGPDDRFGYFVYPLGLLGWLALTRGTALAPAASRLVAGGWAGLAAGGSRALGRGARGQDPPAAAAGEARQDDAARARRPSRPSGPGPLVPAPRPQPADLRPAMRRRATRGSRAGR